MAADSSISGTQIECPTCFQKVIVPQAPTADSKYILSATQYIRPQTGVSAHTNLVARRSRLAPAVFAITAFACVAAAAILLRKTVFQPGGPKSPIDSAASTAHPCSRPAWSLDLAGAVYPTVAAAGRISGMDFVCERAVLQGGVLTLRQGRGRASDLRVTLHLSGKGPEDLRGRSFTVTPEDVSAPCVVLHWKDGQRTKTQTFTKGFALKLAFGEPAAGRMPGEIYLCLPDAEKSCVAGTFKAQIRTPPVRKSRSPGSQGGG